MEENDIINYVLIELKENNVTENLDKTNLDFDVVYMLFDLLEHLGVITRKLDNNQRFLMWTGFAQIRKKYGIVFKVDSNKISRDNIIHMKVSEGSQKKYATNTEQFIASFFYQIYTKHAQDDEKFITHDEFEQLKSEILLRDLGAKDAEERTKVLRILMQIMVYIGLVEKQTKFLQDEDSKTSQFISGSKFMVIIPV